MTLLNSVIYNLKKIIPDELYLKILYRHHLGEKLNITEPKTFNEKIQWLKIHDRRIEYINFVDKYSVRQYISETIGNQFLIPLLGVYESVEDIEWDLLPKKFVMKCTHGSQCNIICTDKNKLDIEKAKKQLKRWLKKNWYWYGREWPYKNIKPRIICEKYMIDESGVELKDYKIFCFHGEPKIVEVDYNRFKGLMKNLYDKNWNYIPLSFNRPTDSNKVINRPERLEDMLMLSRVLAQNYPFIRIDFYSIKSRIYFGEMTFYPISGLGNFNPKEFDYKLGSWINISELKKKSSIKN